MKRQTIRLKLEMKIIAISPLQAEKACIFSFEWILQAGRIEGEEKAGIREKRN